MYTTLQSMRLGGFVQPVIDSLEVPPPTNIWRKPSEETEKAVDKACYRLGALAHAFHEAGKAEDLAKHATGPRCHPFSGQVLQLALQARSFIRRRVGYKADVTPDAKEAWEELRKHLTALFLGDPLEATSVRAAIREACEAAIRGDEVQVISSSNGISSEVPSPTSTLIVGQSPGTDPTHETEIAGLGPSESLIEGQALLVKDVEIPKWDKSARKLTFGGRELKHYKKHPAPNQTMVLQAFQDAGWLCSVPSPVRKDQVRETVRSLNAALGKDSPIRFSSDGTGKAIRWDKSTE